MDSINNTTHRNTARIKLTNNNVAQRIDRRHKRRSSLLLYLATSTVLARFLFAVWQNPIEQASNLSVTSSSVAASASHSSNEADLLVYELRPNYTKPLRHMDEIDPSILQIPRHRNPYYYPIDIVHRNGWMHAGAWIHVLDLNFKILLLQRGPHLVTSPNCWGLVGEHKYKNETDWETAQRGLHEELGLHVDWKSSTKLIPLTERPLLYIRDYGPTLGGRADLQITWMWYIQLDRPHSHVLLQLDDEVANHTWMELPQVREWIQRNGSDFGYPETQQLLLKGIECLEQQREPQ